MTETGTFEPLLHVAARWRSLAGGLEHVTVEALRDSIFATGVLIGGSDQHDVAIWYRIWLDSRWQVKQASLHATDSRTVILTSRGPGDWRDGDGKPMPHLDGCIDVDISGSAFTNSLPVRRLAWQQGQSRELLMAYVHLDTMQPSSDGQRYTCRTPGRQFLYESLDDDFSAEITFDENGLVRSYDGLFERLP